MILGTWASNTTNMPICTHGNHPMGCLWCSAIGPQHPLHERVRQLEADLAQARAETKEAERLRAEMFDQVHEIQQESEGRLNRAEAAEATIATLREAPDEWPADLRVRQFPAVRA